MKKPILFLLLTACLLCSVILLSLTTASAATHSGECGEDITWEFDPSTGTLSITGTGWMSYSLPDPPSFEEDPFYFDNVDPVAPWRHVNSKIEKIVVSEGITNLYEKAFTGCYNVKEVSLPSTLTYIGEKVFYGCTSLKSLTLPEGLKSIDYIAFAYCGLESIVIPGTVTGMDMLCFESCENLKEVVISEGVTALGTRIFENCTALTDLTIADSVMAIDSSFNGCTALESVILPKNLVTLSGGFSRCTALKSIVIPEGVAKIGSYTFRNCVSLSEVTMTAVTAIEESAFEGCTSLASITLPEGLTTIGKNAFLNCTELANVTFPGTISSVDPRAFSNTPLLTDPAGWDKGVLYFGNYLYQAMDASLEEVSVREGTTIIGEYAFRDCTALKKVVLPPTVAFVGPYAFYHCSNLAEITIPDSVTTIGTYAFFECAALTELEIPASVTTMGSSAFRGCTGLKKVSLGGSVQTLESYLFYGCTALKEIELTGVVTLGVEVFSDCSSLEEIEIPASVTTIKDDAFRKCSSLKKVTFLANNVKNIGPAAFMDCAALTDITLPEGLTTINAYMFYGCVSLKNVTLPESAKTLNSRIFGGCKSLLTVYIPKNVTTIENANVFEDCYALTGVWVAEENTAYASDAYGALYNKNKTTLIYFPQGYVGDYEIPEGVTAIAKRQFSDYVNLTSITIPASVTSIGEDAFRGCLGLTGVWVAEDHPNYSSDEYGVLFNKQKTLLKYFPTAFCGTYEIPEGVTSIEAYAFAYNTGLTEVTVPGTVHGINSYAFAYAQGLQNAILSPGIETIGSYVFYDCTSLKKVILPTSVDWIVAWAFSHCENLEELYILNPDCSLEIRAAGTLGPTDKTVVYAYPDSTIHQYAQKHGYTFIPLVTTKDITINHSVDLANELSINYMIKADQLAEYEGLPFTLKVEIPVFEGNTQVGTKTDELQPTLKGSYYYFTLSGLTAVQMNDEVSATVHIPDGILEVVSQTDRYSIAIYAYSQLKKSNAPAELKTMCADLVRYGAAAQRYKGYRTDAIADSAMIPAQKAYLTDLSTVTYYDRNRTLEDVTDPTVTWAGKTLSLDSRVTVRYVVDLSAYEGSLEDLSLAVTYTDVSGNTVTSRITELATFREDKNWYAFDFADLRGAELRAVLSAAVYEGETQVSPTIEYSVDSYCVGRTGALGTLCKAMMAYSDSALAYFTK